MRQVLDWQTVEWDVAHLGVSLACRKHGIHRSTWYRRLGTPRKDAPPPHLALAASVLAISAERPAWGCDRIAYFLELSGVQVSSPTVQKILIAHGLGRRKQRLDRSLPGRDSAPGEAESSR